MSNNKWNFSIHSKSWIVLVPHLPVLHSSSSRFSMKKWLNMSDVRNILYLSWEMASQLEFKKKKPVLGHNSISIGSTRNLSIPQKNIPRRKVAFPIQGNCTSDLVCGGFPLSARIYCIQFACTQAAALPPPPPPPHLTQHCINSQNAFFGSDKQPGRVRCPFYLPGSLQEQHQEEGALNHSRALCLP